MRWNERKVAPLYDCFTTAFILVRVLTGSLQRINLGAEVPSTGCPIHSPCCVFTLLFRKAFEVGAYLVTHVAESGLPILLRPLDNGRIFEALMQARCRTGEEWTALLDVVADGQHVIEVLPMEFIEMFRAVRSNIDANFFQDSNHFSPHDARLRAGALHFKAVPRVMPQEAFGHLRPGRIAGTEDQYPFLFHASIHLPLHVLRPARGTNVACGCTLSRPTA